MSISTVHMCQCSYCQQGVDHPDKGLHRQMNLFVSRLDEQQRRWYVALEANRIGRGGAVCYLKSPASMIRPSDAGNRS